ncbi:MAG TPA: LptA/OstA family protein [Hyphomicrobiales bacterium]|nr:LptA/OstA family protein [Hyphomicrobiales bacterium]
MRRHAACLAALIAALPLAAGTPADAQSVTGAFQDFSGHSKEPVKIEADRLEVRETDQAAIFTGKVEVVQGQSTLRAKKLTIEYTEPPKAAAAPNSAGAAAAAPAPAAPVEAAAAKQAKGPAAKLPTTSRDIRRLIADGGVVVTSGDQRATGGHGVFDMASNTVTLTGNVVLTQGGNVLRGERLVVDLTTQRSRLESPKSGGRVEGVFLPSAAQTGGSGGTAPAPRRHEGTRP